VARPRVSAAESWRCPRRAGRRPEARVPTAVAPG